MENALGASGYTATMLALVFVVLGLGIAALFAALFLPARWKIKYRMELVFVVLLVGMVWYADRESTAIYKAYQGEIKQAGYIGTAEAATKGENFDHVFRVIAFQWGFAFITEDGKISRNAEVAEPGEKILFRIFSNDVIHGFNIPAVGITAEFEPGVERDLWIRTPEKPGKYLIQCLNYCGVGHAQMKAWLVIRGEEA
jgi:heme/copper-type cytochrome/quinol oxidase subunit 2